MISSKGYAAQRAKSAIEPFSFERRDPLPSDVVIAIQFSGIGHSDVHQVTTIGFLEFFRWSPVTKSSVGSLTLALP